MKKGDAVIVKNLLNLSGYTCQNVIVGGRYILDEQYSSSGVPYWTLGDSQWAWESQLELINNLTINNKCMDLKEKFLTSIKKEPQKSFRKAGITNGDDLLTEDGKQVFLAWLLEKHGSEFKSEVVDELLKEDKED